MATPLQVATSAPRHGRMFEPVHERLLHQDALRACSELPGASRGVRVVAEFAGPIGVPDFTAYVGGTEALLARAKDGVDPVLNEIDAGIVSALTSARPKTAIAVADKLGWPLETVARRLPALLRTGAVASPRLDAYVRQPSISTSGRLYAVEAKVEDWRRALTQVRTYRIWADAYVLVMGDLSAKATERLTEEVVKDRGGLMVAGRWVLRPRLGFVAPHRRLQAQEALWFATSRGL